jgi:hypothetical protein
VRIYGVALPKTVHIVPHFGTRATEKTGVFGMRAFAKAVGLCGLCFRECTLLVQNEALVKFRFVCVIETHFPLFKAVIVGKS